MKRLYLLVSIVFLYGISSAATFNFNEFNGMNSVGEPMMIGEDESPDMSNVDPSKDANSLSRRKGQTSLFNLGISTGITVSFGTVKNSTYDRLLVAYASRVSAFDTAYNETVILSTATEGYSWDFAQYLDYTYMTNSTDTCQYTDGYSIFENSTMPKCTSIVFFNNTCFVANAYDNRSRIYISKYGQPLDWTTGAEETDGDNFNIAGNGEQVIDLEILGNSVLVLCSGSIMKITGTGNPYQVIEVDKSIGCKSKGSVTTSLGYTYFLGSDGQYYRTDGSIVENISKLKVQNEINVIGSLSSGEDSFSASLTEDFNQGISSTVDTNSNRISSLYDYLLWNTTTNWKDWTCVGISTNGFCYPDTGEQFVNLSRYTSYWYTYYDFSNSDLSSYNFGCQPLDIDEHPVGDTSATSGAYLKLSDSSGSGSTIQIMKTNLPLPTPLTDTYSILEWQYNKTISMDLKLSNKSDVVFRFDSDGGRVSLGIQNTASTGIYFYRVAGSSTITSDIDSYISNDTWFNLKISNFNSSGLQIYTCAINDVVVSTITNSTLDRYSDTTPAIYWMTTPKSGSPYDVYVDSFNVAISTYNTYGVMTSSIVYTNNRPLYYNSYETASAFGGLSQGTTIATSIRTSTSPSMGDSPAWVFISSLTTTSTSYSIINTIDDKPYAQIKHEFYTTYSTTTPHLERTYLYYMSTGYYITEPINTTNITAYGLFTSDDYTASGTTIYYSICVTSALRNQNYLESIATWTAISNNSIPIVGLNNYVYLKSSFSFTDSGNAYIDSLGLSWLSSNSSIGGLTSCWFDNRLYVGCMASTTSARNDKIFVYDPNLVESVGTDDTVSYSGAWWKYATGIYPSAMTTWKNKFIIGSSSGSCVAQMFEGDTDLGENIVAYYYTKPITPGGLLNVSSFDLQSFLFKRQTSGSLNVEYYLNGNTTSDKTLTLDMSGGYPINIQTYRFPTETNSQIIQYKISNVLGSDFTFFNLSGTSTEKPLILQRVQ